MNARSLLIKPLAISIIALGIGYSSVSLALTDPSVSVGVAEPAPVIGAAEPAPAGADYVYDISRQGTPAPQIGARVLVTAGTPTMMMPEQLNMLIASNPSEVRWGINAGLDEATGRLLGGYTGLITAMPDADLGTVRMLAAYAPNIGVTLADDKELSAKQIAAITGGFTVAGPSALAERNFTLRGSADPMLTAARTMAAGGFVFGRANLDVTGTIPESYDGMKNFAQYSLGLGTEQVGYNFSAALTPFLAQQFTAGVKEASELPGTLGFSGGGSIALAPAAQAYITRIPTGTVAAPMALFKELDAGGGLAAFAKANLEIPGMTQQDMQTAAVWVNDDKLLSVAASFASPQDASNALRVVDSSGLAYHFSSQQGITMARSVADMPKLAAAQIQGMQAQAVEASAGVPFKSSLETDRVLKANSYTADDLKELSAVPNVSMARGEDGTFYAAQQPQRGIDLTREDAQ